MKKIKWNWGTGILLSIIIFMLILIGIVYVFMNQDVDLVTKDYYGKELKYQDHINKMNNTSESGKEIGISYINNSVKLVFPDSASDVKPSGSIYFYRPSGSNKDFSLPVEISSGNIQTINAASFDKGLWTIKIEWEMGGKNIILKNH